MTTLSCDVAVIGAGTAGLTAENRARQEGARTFLIDEAFRGTTCATIGCMPSKLLIAAADAAASVSGAETFGIHATLDVDGPAVMKRLRTVRDRFVSGVKEGIDRLPDGVAIQARAEFRETGLLRLSNGQEVRARSVVIATGASPAIPAPFENLGNSLLTNENIFELADLPGSVGVVGAGPLGVELGQALARLGVRVRIFEQGETIGGMRDAKVSAVMHDLLSDEVPIELGAEIETGRTSEGAIRVRWNGREEIFERLLLAAGRPPNLAGLNLDAAGIECDNHGTPVFDPQTMQCGSAPIFIAGDANHDRPVLHEAAAEGAIAGYNAARFPDVTAGKRTSPFAITFTRPEGATIGAMPGADDEDHATGEASYEDQGRARVEARLGGLCRLHARKSDGRLTGASLCMPEAGHIAHLLVWAVETGQTVDDLLDMPFYHPTLEEGLKPALRSLCEELERPRSGYSNDADAPGA